MSRSMVSAFGSTHFTNPKTWQYVYVLQNDNVANIMYSK